MKDIMTVNEARAMLGLPERYGWKQLHAAYARQAWAWHPDLFWGTDADMGKLNRRMALINRAYEMLRSKLFYETMAQAIG